MKIVIFAIILWTLSATAFSQDAKEYYEKGMAALKADKLDEAIDFFDKSIELKNDEFVSWYNRGIVKSWQRRYEESIVDFNQAILLNPSFKKSYNSRANSLRDITEYESALLDYNFAIKLDSHYIDALFNRATLFELLGKRDEACKDYNLLYSLGDEEVKRDVELCKEPPRTGIYPILRLTKTANSDQYGFNSEFPIKVGPGPDGGPANQRAYLNLLRDVNGKPINYERKGSCCEYKSENGLFGAARVDIYEINYTNENGNSTKSLIYISMWDYEEPQIIFGFKTVGQK